MKKSLEETLGAIEKDVELYRVRAARDSSYLPNLAYELHEMAICLHDLGRLEEGLGVANESLELLRQLAKNTPYPFKFDAAMIITAISVILEALGRLEEALSATEEAVGMLKDCSLDDDPNARASDLVLVMRNQGLFLANLGLIDEALRVSKEAVALGLELKVSHPKSFRGDDLALSISTLAYCLNKLGRFEEAILYSEEGIKMFTADFIRDEEKFRVAMEFIVESWSSALKELNRPLDQNLLSPLKEHGLSWGHEARFR